VASTNFHIGVGTPLIVRATDERRIQERSRSIGALHELNGHIPIPFLYLNSLE
jgi:hypothetical protein